MLAVRPAGRTCNSRILQWGSRPSLEIVEVYAVAQTLVIGQVCGCHRRGAGWACSESLVIAGECASGTQETVGSVPTAVADMMHTALERVAVEAEYSVNCLEALRMNVQSAMQDAESVQQAVVEAEKSLCLPHAVVGQRRRLVRLLADTEHQLWRKHEAARVLLLQQVQSHWLHQQEAVSFRDERLAQGLQVQLDCRVPLELLMRV